MSWFRIDDKSAFHRKVLKAGNEAWGAICRAGAVSSGEGTDGRVSLETMLAIAPMRVWEKGIKAGLVEKVDAESYQLHDYLQWNESAAEIEAKAAMRRKKSEQAAQARWGARGRIRSEQHPSMPEASQDSMSGNAPSMPGALPQAHTLRCPDPDPDPGSSLQGGAEDLTGSRAHGPTPKHHHQRGLSTGWILGELRRHPTLGAVANEDFAAALLGVLVARPRPLDLVAQGIAEAAVDVAGHGLTGEAIGRKVRTYVTNAKRRVEPPPEVQDAAPEADQAEVDRRAKVAGERARADADRLLREAGSGEGIRW